MSDSYDRNVLYGILAFQLGFVGRDTLLDAFQNFSKQNNSSLKQILSQQGVFNDNVEQLLDALVEEHLQAHENQPEKSLAALSSIGSIREELEEIGDVDLNATLGHVPYETSFPSKSNYLSVDSVGQQSDGRFRVVKMHAKGGLGQVSVAMDQELSREVALKELQNQFADDENNRARFAMEAEITGALEHPGIVPVYGAGHYADGRPYYAMRFVRGDSLQDAVQEFHERLRKGELRDQYELELRKLLRRFTDVCEAIEYAHSRGVLHRDLKPGNIMLGRYGETLVVDWGLAKALGTREPKRNTEVVEEKTLLPPSASGSAPTQLGSAIGTPHYMSPEQAAGRTDELGTASDVYSLGATLYSLLTGQPPFKGQEVGEILAQVQLGLIKPPSLITSMIPKPLEAICLKAMARQPQDRYISPRALADDVELWLADQKVLAYAEPVHVRVGRWMRKNKVIAGAGISALAVALISALVIAGVLADSNQKLADQEAAAISARDEAISARNEATDLAQKNEKLAVDAQQQTAEAYRRQAIELLEKGDLASGLPRLVNSIESIPLQDTRRKKVALKNISAWCQGKIRLNAIRELQFASVDPMPKTGRILVNRIAKDEQPQSVDPVDYYATEDVYFRMLDAKTLEPVGPEFGPSVDFADYDYDVKEDLICMVILHPDQEVDPAEISTFPAKLKITDENLQRLQVFETEFEIIRCKLSDGSLIGKPLISKQRYFSLLPEDENAPIEFDERGEPIDQVSDEYIGTHFQTGICILRDCVTNELWFGSMETGEEIDLDIPDGLARMSIDGLLAVLSEDKKIIQLFDLKTMENHGKPLVHNQVVREFEFNEDGDQMVTLTEDGVLHGWKTSKSFFAKVDTKSEVLITRPLKEISMAGNKVLTVDADDVVQLWASFMSSRKMSLLRTYQESKEQRKYSNLTTLLSDEKGRYVVLENSNKLEVWNPIAEPDSELGLVPAASGNRPVIFSLNQEQGKSYQILWDIDENHCVTYSNDQLKLWDLKYQEAIEIEHPTRVANVSISSERRVFVTTDVAGAIRLWNFKGDLISSSMNTTPGRQRRFLKFEGSLEALNLLTFEHRITEDYIPRMQHIQLWEMPKLVQAEKPKYISGNFISLGPKTSNVYTAEKFFGFKSDESLAVKYFPPVSQYISPDENRIEEGYFQVLDLRDLSKPPISFGDIKYRDTGIARLLEISPDGKRVGLVSTYDRDPDYMTIAVVQLWDVEEGEPIGPQLEIENLSQVYWTDADGQRWYNDQYVFQFSPDLTKFFAAQSRKAETSGTSEEDLQLYIWDLRQGKTIAQPLVHRDEVLSAEFSPDSRLLATASQDGQVKLWDSVTGKLIAGPLPHRSAVKDVYFLPDGKSILTVTMGNYWQTWHVPTGEPLISPTSFRHDDMVVSAISPDGSRLYTAGDEGNLQEWDIPTGMAIGPPQEFDQKITDILAGEGFLLVNVNYSWKVFPLQMPTFQSLEECKTWISASIGARISEGDVLELMNAKELLDVDQKLTQRPGTEELLEIKVPEVISLNLPEYEESKPEPPKPVYDH